MRGERKKYNWVKVGRSLILSDILSAIALEQIKKLDKITLLRKKRAQYLLKKLKSLRSKIILPMTSEGTDPNWHIFAIRTNKRDALQAYLQKHGIHTGIHYPIPLPALAAYKYLGHKPEDFPVAMGVKDDILSLPMHGSMPDEHVAWVIEQEIPEAIMRLGRAMEEAARSA